jgi:hypothetical protein
MLSSSSPRSSSLLFAQGAYFAATGIWSIVDAESFQKVTGPKTDVWLVKTVGVLVTCIGGVLMAAARRRRVTPEISALAISSAVGLTVVDVVYTLKKRISPIYLLDAAAEVGFVAASAALRQAQGTPSLSRGGTRLA